MQENKAYTLPVGKEEYNRLIGLNEIFNPYTLRFFDNHLGRVENYNVLDIGCGFGIITRQLAKRAKNGKVVGIDISKEQIAMANKMTDDEKYQNLVFKILAGEDTSRLKEKFDLVYFRFVIEHLSDPLKLLENIKKILSKHGKIFIEVITSYDAVFSDPDSEAFQGWKNLILQQPKLFNTDFYIGKKLRSYFNENGYTVLAQELCQPIMINNESRWEFLSGLKGDKFKSLYVKHGIFSASEYDAMVDKFLAFAKEDNIITAPQYTQLLVQIK